MFNAVHMILNLHFFELQFCGCNAFGNWSIKIYSHLPFQNISNSSRIYGLNSDISFLHKACHDVGDKISVGSIWSNLIREMYSCLQLHLSAFQIFLVYLYTGSLFILLYFQLALLRGVKVKNSYFDPNIRISIRPDGSISKSPCATPTPNR